MRHQSLLGQIKRPSAAYHQPPSICIPTSEYIGIKRRNQRGIALITALVMLSVVTLLAVVGLQNSTINIRMVGNEQVRERVFNVSNSEVHTLVDAFFIGDSPAENDDIPPAGNYSDINLVIENKIDLVPNDNINIDRTLVGASSIGVFTTTNYHVTSTAAIDNIQSSQQIGVEILQPAGN